MNEGINELNKKRQGWVDVNQENGFGDGIKRLLTDLYPDNAHFIYELLQNAEDTGASCVRFLLQENCLEYEHNGKRMFTLKDVDSITSIAVSSKRDDPTSIGKFGVGFKAVFAYTNTPEVHSGKYHFRICGLVVPEVVDTSTDSLGENTTRFIFPFDHAKKTPEQAVKEISEGLRNLGDNTLLFLSHICEIEYLLPNEAIGSLKRVEKNGKRIEIHADLPSAKQTISHWMRFDKNDVSVKDDESNKQKHCRIAIAFSLKNLAEKGDLEEWKVVPLDKGQVSIFFPAEKETSELHFHIHAPFASTVARDSIKACESNQSLLRSIAALTAESLIALRDDQLLNIASYNAFPIRKQDFIAGSLYQPIYDEVRKAFENEELLPTNDGGFVRAVEAKLARGKELVELFSSEQLSQLFDGKKLKWLDSSITVDGNNDLHAYFAGRKKTQWSKEWEALPLCDGILITPKSLAPKLNDVFLKGQSIDWLVSFIPFAINNAELKTLPFIRLEDNTHVAIPSDDNPRTAWLRPNGVESLGLTEFPLICDDLAKNDIIKKLLKEKGVREIDAAAIVEKSILLLYSSVNRPFNKDEYVEHLQEIARALKESSGKAKGQLKNLLNETPWLACVHASDNEPDNIIWKQPNSTNIFICTKDYEAWFVGNINDSACFLWSEEGYSLLIDLGETLGFRRADLMNKNNVKSDEWDKKLRCYRKPQSGFDAFAQIVGLEWAINNPTLERSLLLWNELLPKYQSYIKGKEERSGNKSFTPSRSHEIYDDYSTFGNLCAKHAWLPDKKGGFHKPQDLLLSDLHEELDSDSLRAKEVAEKLGMKQPVSIDTVQSLGFSSEDELREAQKIVQSPEKHALFEKFIAQQNELSTLKKSLPNIISRDPERRAEKIAENIQNTPEKISEHRKRAIDPDCNNAQSEAKMYLKRQYTVGKIMICQLCQKRQPVIIDDEPYFEVITCIRGFNIHAEYNNLALCPNHAAMYKNGGKELPNIIQEAIKKSSDQTIPLNLAGNEIKLYFTEQHLADLRTVITNVQKGGI